MTKLALPPILIELLYIEGVPRSRGRTRHYWTSWHVSLKKGSISSTIFEYIISTICKMRSNKNNTRQLKILTKQLKVNLTITSQTKLNASYLIPMTKHSHISHTNQIRRCHRFAATTQSQPRQRKEPTKKMKFHRKE